MSENTREYSRKGMQIYHEGKPQKTEAAVQAQKPPCVKCRTEIKEVPALDFTTVRKSTARKHVRHTSEMPQNTLLSNPARISVRQLHLGTFSKQTHQMQIRHWTSSPQFFELFPNTSEDPADGTDLMTSLKGKINNKARWKLLQR